MSLNSSILYYMENKMDRNLLSSSSFLRKQESIYLNLYWIPAGVYPVLCYGAGMTPFIFMVRGWPTSVLSQK